MEIQVAKRDDNKALLNLSRKAVQEGVISLYADQSPDFFALPDIMSSDYHIYKAVEKGRMVGCIGEFATDVLFDGRPARMLYAGELKVLPDSPGTLALALASHVAKSASDGRYDVGLGFILDGNERSRKVTEYIADKFTRRRDGGLVTSYQLLPIKKYRENPSYEVMQAEEKHIPAIAKMLEQHYRSYNCSPIFSEKWLRRELAKHDSFSIRNFRIACKDGKIAAAAAFWDQSPLRRNCVGRFSFSIKMALMALNLLRPFYAIPDMPRPGDQLNYQFLRFPVIRDGEIEALRTIIHREINILGKQKDFHFLWASFHESDPLKEAVSKMRKTGTRAHVYNAVLSERVEEKGTQSPLYIDFSLV